MNDKLLYPIATESLTFHNARILVIEDVKEDKLHPFRTSGRPDIHVYPKKDPEKDRLMYPGWSEQGHYLTSPFFIELKRAGRIRDALPQGNEYKYKETGSKRNRKYGDFRVALTDPEMFEYFEQEGSREKCAQLEDALWKSGLGCVYKRNRESPIIRITFNQQDTINLVPKDLADDFIIGNWCLDALEYGGKKEWSLDG